MIPAILSCLFVIYLYQSLNAEPAGEASPDSLGDVGASSQRLEALTTRLGELETRLKVVQSDQRRQA